ncbi:MAG TPA: ABC transporter permease [Candidatus Acidoferrum sp.]|nr:ABC transporter permease [Candidatus Acidoferrum sp.]
MSLLGDSITMCRRELLIFMANFRTNFMRTAIFPLVILIFFSFLGASVTNTPVAVVNYANNLQSNQFITALGTKSLINAQVYPNENAALAALTAGKINFVVVILPTFPSSTAGSPAVQVYYDNVQYSVTATVLPTIQQDAAEFIGQGSFQSQEYLPSSTPVASEVATPITGANGNYEDFLFSGVIGMIIVFGSIFSGGIAMITDRLGGNIKSFLITPINKSAILIGRVISGAIQSIFSVIIVVIIGLLLGSTIAMGIVGIVWIVILGMLLSIVMTSIAAIVAARLKNLQAYTIFGQAIGLPLWFISGGIFPVTSFPPILQAISKVDPLTYAVQGFRYVILQGSYPLTSAFADIGILLIFGAITTIISILLFKSTID